MQFTYEVCELQLRNENWVLSASIFCETKLLSFNLIVRVSNQYFADWAQLYSVGFGFPQLMHHDIMMIHDASTTTKSTYIGENILRIFSNERWGKSQNMKRRKFRSLHLHIHISHGYPLSPMHLAILANTCQNFFLQDYPALWEHVWIRFKLFPRWLMVSAAWQIVESVYNVCRTSCCLHNASNSNLNL